MGQKGHSFPVKFPYGINLDQWQVVQYSCITGWGSGVSG
jgi:hypothetical protein